MRAARRARPPPGDGVCGPLHALTVHRSQGSQFDRVTAVLPAPTRATGLRERLEAP